MDSDSQSAEISFHEELTFLEHLFSANENKSDAMEAAKCLTAIHSPADPQQHEAVSLLLLRQTISTETVLQPDHTQPETHGVNSLNLSLVRHGIRTQIGPYETLRDSICGLIDDTPDDTTGGGKIYEKPGSTFCPVRCFEKYLSKLNPKLEV
ncbi:hypothetical protein DPMN_191306 [Dreissena polymorpha]|uniref:Uncharacterized protein n=1 Tax=Dreissena polymorpha TaxID=45954 RepID=A0A9D3XYD0_DREPO|nr:hypothetical protein DPMN_191306 [Dreissena polymorpha]